MSDERALSLADPSGPPVRAAEYDAICEALMETSRGRWFLSEFARRVRHVDTEQVLAAIGRIESAIGAERQNPVIDSLRGEVTAMAEAIARLETGLAAIGREPEPAVNGWHPQEVVELVRDLGGRLDTMIELWGRANAVADRPGETARARDSNGQAGPQQYHSGSQTEALPAQPPQDAAEPQPVLEPERVEAETAISSQAGSFVAPSPADQQAAEEETAPILEAALPEQVEIAPEHPASLPGDAQWLFETEDESSADELPWIELPQPDADLAVVAADEIAAPAEVPSPAEMRAPSEVTDQDIFAPVDAEPAAHETAADETIDAQLAAPPASLATEIEREGPAEAMMADEPAPAMAEAVEPNASAPFGWELALPVPHPVEDRAATEAAADVVTADVPSAVASDAAGAQTTPVAWLEESFESVEAQPREAETAQVETAEAETAEPETVSPPEPEEPTSRVAAAVHEQPSAAPATWQGPQDFLPDNDFGVAMSFAQAAVPAEAAREAVEPPSGVALIDAMVIDFVPAPHQEEAGTEAAIAPQTEATAPAFETVQVASAAPASDDAAPAAVLEEASAADHRDDEVSAPTEAMMMAAAAVVGDAAAEAEAENQIVVEAAEAETGDTTSATATVSREPAEPWPATAEPPYIPSAPPSLREALSGVMVSDLDQAARLDECAADVSAPVDVSTTSDDAIVGGASATEAEFQAAARTTDAEIGDTNSVAAAETHAPSASGPLPAEAAHVGSAGPSLREALTGIMITDLDDAARLDESAREVSAAAFVDQVEATEHPAETAAAPATEQPDSGSLAPGDTTTETGTAVPDNAPAAAAEVQTASHSTDVETRDQTATADAASHGPSASASLPVVAEAPAAVPAAAPPASNDPLAPLAALSEDETIALFT